MKKLLLLSNSLFLIPYFIFSQNVGIGTTTPQSRLHISSPADEALRLEANQPYVSLYSNGVYKGYLWKSPNSIEIGSAAGSNLPVTLAPDGVQRVFIHPNGNVGIGAINPSHKLQVEGMTYLNGFVGIQNNNPAAPLSFSASLGKKIALYPGPTGTAGFAAEANLLQIYADNASADIAFGYDQNNNFIERMRVKGNGNLGIGNTTPTEKIEVTGNIKAVAYKYSSPKTFYINLPANAFNANHSADSFYRGTTAIFYIGVNPPHASFISAPFYPPHGAMITELEVHFYDVSANTDIAVELWATGLNGNHIPVTLSSSGTPGLSSATQTLAVPFQVDTQIKAFSIEAFTTGAVPWPAANIRLRSVRIAYTVTETQ